MSGTFEVTVTHDLTMDEIADIVITAFEGGINYWCDLVEPVELLASGWHRIAPDKYERLMIDGCGGYANPAFWEAGHGYIIYFEGEDDGKVLTAERLAKAISALDRERVARLINPGEYDAEDADVAVQTAIFGEIVYG